MTHNHGCRRSHPHLGPCLCDCLRPVDSTPTITAGCGRTDDHSAHVTDARPYWCAGTRNIVTEQITLDMDPDRFAYALAHTRPFPAHTGTTARDCPACHATAGWSERELQTRHDLTLGPEACHHNCGHDRRTCRRGVCERWCRL